MSPYNASLANGVDASAAYGLWQTFTFHEGPWVAGETWEIRVTDDFGSYLIGPGDVSLLAANFALTLNQRVYLTAGTKFYMSGIADPTGWNEQNPGAGSVTVPDWYNAPEDLVALASYQGKLAVFSSTNISIYEINADPDLFSKVQTLPNIGTIAPLSVQSFGDMDVVFLHSSGFRSLQTRDNYENAVVVDTGSPIDLLIQPIVADNDVTAACGIFEPEANRYWGFVKDTIYVRSYFPSLKILAWSTYLPTYEVDGVQTSFVPVKFVVHDRTVYCRTSDGKIMQYGGASLATSYDNCVATVLTPWLDGKEPATNKTGKGLQAALTGAWTLSASMDYLASPVIYEEVIKEGTSYTANNDRRDASFDLGIHPFDQTGTHFQLKAVTSGSSSAKLSSVTFHYNKGAGRP
jgi:hypothetical protein